MNKDGGWAAYNHILPSIIPPYCIQFRFAFQNCGAPIQHENMVP